MSNFTDSLQKYLDNTEKTAGNAQFRDSIKAYIEGKEEPQPEPQRHKPKRIPLEETYRHKQATEAEIAQYFDSGPYLGLNIKGVVKAINLWNLTTIAIMGVMVAILGGNETAVFSLFGPGDFDIAPLLFVWVIWLMFWAVLRGVTKR